MKVGYKVQRTLVISDIHGAIDLFEKLLEKVKYDCMNDQLILLGDYVDRGPNAKAVIEKVMRLKEQGARVLKGNHEDMMIKALTSDEEKFWNHWAVRNGGDKTLLSYGFSERDLLVEEGMFQKPKLDSKELQGHLEFIQGLEHYIETDDFIFVHAGVEPNVPVCESDPYTLVWIRDEFHRGYNGEKIVIFGHTPTTLLHKEKRKYEVFFGVNRIIGIDGGAVYGGQLNCLELPSQKVYSVKGV